MAKNYHSKNLREMHQVETAIQQKREELVQQQDKQREQTQWKMRRFQSVESKLARNLKGGSAAAAGGAAQLDSVTPKHKNMTKGEAMRMQQQH